MQPTIVYVHGAGAQAAAEVLKRRWDSALFGQDMAEATRMAYWSSLRPGRQAPEPGPQPLAGAALAQEATTEELDEVLPSEGDPPEAFVARTLAELGEPAPRASGGPGAEPMGREGGPRTAAGLAAAGMEGTADTTVTTPTAGVADWLSAMAHAADALANGESAEHASLSPLEALPLPRAVRQAAFRLLVRNVVEDVHAYLFQPQVGEGIRDVLHDALDGAGDPVVVIGHSLGTIVAYDVLRQRQHTRAALLMTLGSPLGITEIQDHLDKPLAVPEGVGAWANVSDARDVVALDHTVRPEYTPAERVTDYLVVNDSGNHHGALQYLASTPARSRVRAVLNGR